jgi:5'-nucleotidase (lipoprotein e(P4) family)
MNSLCLFQRFLAQKSRPLSNRAAMYRSAIISTLLIAFLGSSVYAQSVVPEADYRYGAVTWMQTSAEYRLLTQQTYRYALLQLAVGCQDRNWTADEYQLKEGKYQPKPPAVILDLDETVLDNSYYNARNIIRGTGFTLDNWHAWCREEKAEAIPGALEFVKGAEGLGVKVFYLTNREDEVKDSTIGNLIQLGFSASADNVLTKNEREGRADDKLSRRASVAENYRIVLLIGDSMSDLCDGMETTSFQRRNQIAAEKSDWLGSRWIMLPNPSYGSWQRALPKSAKALDTKE